MNTITAQFYLIIINLFFKNKKSSLPQFQVNLSLKLGLKTVYRYYNFIYLLRFKYYFSYSEVKGRHFVASTKIEYGELLIFENPFASVLLPEYYNSFCYHCYVPLKYYSIP